MFMLLSLFLGSKIYIDIVECIGDDCNVIRGEHIRMKGIPTPYVKHLQKKKTKYSMHLNFSIICLQTAI